MLFSLPIALVVVYIITDPFKVIYHYKQYFRSGISENIVSLNKDYVSTQIFLQNCNKYHYDSYIFGGSRSIHFHIAEWQKHITARQCFHFDATAETLFGIEKKVEFLHKQRAPIRNALFVLDYSILRKTTNGNKHIYIKHPAISGESRIAFQCSFLADFFDPIFLKQYLVYLFTHSTRTSPREIKHIITHNEVIQYDSVSNELYYISVEEAVRRNPDSFYKRRKFFKRGTTPQYTSGILGARRVEMLTNIKKILDEEHTNYHIIINPVYDQVKLDTNDLKVLVNIFGKERVHDFSGINDITADYHNYYEISHYRPFVAARMMDSIYAH